MLFDQIGVKLCEVEMVEILEMMSHALVAAKLYNRSENDE